MGTTSRSRLALITPTRGDRPLFEKQYNNIIKNQTVQPDEVIIIDYPPISKEIDLTARYRKGITEATKRGCNIALLWEDDDWYHPDYIKWMISNWENQGNPDVLGVEETYYYHLKLNKLRYLPHPGRSSAFCILLKLPYKHSYPPDNYLYFDLHLFKDRAKRNLKTKTIKFNGTIYAIGMKHGTGLTGGSGHKLNFRWDKTNGLQWLENHCSDNKIYNKISKKLS